MTMKCIQTFLCKSGIIRLNPVPVVSVVLVGVVLGHPCIIIAYQAQQVNKHALFVLLLSILLLLNIV